MSKLLDKRALKNEVNYQNSSKNIEKFVKGLKEDVLTKKYAALSDKVGISVLSTNNVIQTVMEGDCLAIGLSVKRPEAAIADPSRLIIDDIYFTWYDSESYLESAIYYLNKSNSAHGGFSTTNDPRYVNKLAVGASREDVTGIMPLYLFPEHWYIAKRKIQPILGMMCTLDIMGYSSDQYHTVPFLVYNKALQKFERDESEAAQTMLQMIEETCVAMIRGSPFFAQLIAD